MRELVSSSLVMALLMALTLASFAAPASAAEKEALTFDVVQGKGTLSLGGFGSPTASIDAKSHGKTTKGQFYVSYAVGDVRFPEGGFFKGNVTCMWVNGNMAYLVGQVTDSSLGVWEPGDYVVFGVADNADTPDGLNFTVGLDSAPACEPHPDAGPLPITSGDFVVLDDYTP